MSLHGRVENGVVVFQNGPLLPDGTLVEVTPLQPDKAGSGPVPVSKEQRDALLGLIGMWKVEHPPNDEEAERIVEEQRMKKVQLMRVLLDTNVLLDSILQRVGLSTKRFALLCLELRNFMRCPMVARGRVQNGVIILTDGVHLPDGQEVTVLAGGTALAAPRTQALPPHSVMDIPSVSLGPVLHPLTAGDDLLGEMLEGRP